MEFNIIEHGGTAVVLEFARNDRDVNQNEKISYKGSKGEHTIRFWGKNNDHPQWIEKLVLQNNIVPTLLQTKRDLVAGSGFFAYKEVFVADGGQKNIQEVEIPADAQKFFTDSFIDKYRLAAAGELIKHGNIFTEFVRDKGGKIHSISLKECKYVRLGEQNKEGKVTKAYISGDWPTRDKKDGLTEYDKSINQVELYGGEDKKQKKFLLHTGDTLFNDGYYNVPVWYGSRSWIELANSIVKFHQSNIKHGYVIRFHIQIPKDYFYEQPITGAAEELIKARDNAIEKKNTFINKLNDLLAGQEQAGRSIVTEFDFDVALKTEYPGIKITPINIDLKDEALLTLFEKTNTANISAQGIHPTLANIETQGKLSSGSEIRNAYLMYLAIKTPTPRAILLEAINLVKRINRWPEEVHFGFRDIEITTLDEDKSGMKENVSVGPEVGNV